MPDRYQRIVTAPPGRFLARRLGLPVPPPLRRHRPGDRVAPGPVLVGGDGTLRKPVAETLAAAGVELHPRGGDRPAPVAFDASGVGDIAGWSCSAWRPTASPTRRPPSRSGPWR